METKPVDRVEQQNKEMEPADRTGWTGTRQCQTKKQRLNETAGQARLKRRRSDMADRDENRQMAGNLTVDQRLRRRWPESDRSGQTVTEEWQECDQNSFRSGADWSSGNGQTKTGCGGRSGRMMT